MSQVVAWIAQRRGEMSPRERQRIAPLASKKATIRFLDRLDEDSSQVPK